MTTIATAHDMVMAALTPDAFSSVRSFGLFLEG